MAIEPVGIPCKRPAVFFFLVFSAVLAASSFSLGQVAPRWEVFGGYAYRNVDSTTFGFVNRSNLNGFDAEGTFNIKPRWGVTADVGGQYGSQMTVAEALLFSASGQLRNMASIGGNIMSELAAHISVDETDGRCNKRHPGSGCAALHGLNRNHAIFGWSESCVATNPSDLAVALAAMDALVIVRGKAGERQIPLTDFHRLPGGAPERDNVLDRGDLILAVEVPASVEARASHYLKVQTARPMSSRSFQPRLRSPQTADASARRGLRWAASPTSRGGLRQQKPACAEFR